MRTKKVDPLARQFALALTYTDARNRFERVRLFDAKHNGEWAGEIGETLRAVVTRDAEGKWTLTLRRGRESCTFFPVTVARKPLEITFWLPAGWVAGMPAEVYVTMI